MIATSASQRRRQSPRDTATYLFAIGQLVRMKGGFGKPAHTGDIYQVTGRLPPQGDSPQYRIRSDEERHERVTTQDSLEPVAMSRPDEEAALIERTFGQKNGTGAQPSPAWKGQAG